MIGGGGGLGGRVCEGCGCVGGRGRQGADCRPCWVRDELRAVVLLSFRLGQNSTRPLEPPFLELDGEELSAWGYGHG